MENNEIRNTQRSPPRSRGTPPPTPLSPSCFNGVDPLRASVVLGDVLRESNVYLGGSSFGKGLRMAARYYLDNNSSNGEERIAAARDDGDDDDDAPATTSTTNTRPSHLDLPGAGDLNPELFGCESDSNSGGLRLIPPNVTAEDSFYVVDLGVLVSQVYQWRRFFPRVEPFYAVKCNPDFRIVKTLAVMGCNFDCASRNEIRLVQEATLDLLPRKPEIIYANPCKARAHLVEAVCRGVTLVTFDNAAEVAKCAAVSKKIELVLRIITDDRGSQCRFSTKFGAPPSKWRSLLAAAKRCGLQVVGVSFHVGSGCRDASKYELALKDARKLFDIAEREFGMKMRILDIGGGFPGETHGIWNPAVEIDDVVDCDQEHDDDEDKVEGKAVSSSSDSNSDEDEEVVVDDEEDRFMFFKEIAQKVAPIIDDLFPPASGVRVIAEPGRYFAAAAATLCCSVVAARINQSDGMSGADGDDGSPSSAVDDRKAAKALDGLTREDEKELIVRANSMDETSESNDPIMSTIQEELTDYSKLFASQQLTQQEFDVYNDKLDLYEEGWKTAIDLLGPPEPEQLGTQHHTAEGISSNLVAASSRPAGEAQQEGGSGGGGLLALAAAGEAAVSGMVLQAVVDSSQQQDDYAYYVNDGVYGAFNNLMFDHAQVRPRVLQRNADDNEHEQHKPTIQATVEDGFVKLEPSSRNDAPHQERALFASTVFGPTCDSIDVISRSVLLPQLQIGDWLYFNNMGAYTMAAASSFNGFHPSEKFYVCSVQPEYFEEIIKGPLPASASAAEAEDNHAAAGAGTAANEECNNNINAFSDRSSSDGGEEKKANTA